MLYRNLIATYLAPEHFSSWCASFIKDNKLDLNTIMPLPQNFSGDLASWKKKNRGTTADTIPVIVKDTSFYFDSESYDLIALFTKLSELDSTVSFYYRYASDELVTVSESIEFGCGRLMRTEDIKNRAQLACAIWEVDYQDYMTQLVTLKTATIPVSAVSPIDTEDTDVVLDNLFAFEEG